MQQEEGFDEDEGIYDELNLDEEEEKFGLANDEDSDESEDGSEGELNIMAWRLELLIFLSGTSTTNTVEEAAT